MGIRDYEIPATPEEAMADFGRLMASLTDVPDVADAVRAQAMAVLRPEVDDRTPNQARLEVLQFNAYVASTADQVVNAPNLAERSVVGREKFSAVHRTIMKLAQELLTDPAFLQNFTHEEVTNGDVRALLNEIIVDPRLVTDHLLEVFGLDHLKPHEADERTWIYKHEQIPMRAEAIDAIKDFIANKLEPLDADGGTRLRVFRITDGKNRGKVVVTRRKADGGTTLDLTDLHSLSRRGDHIRENYTGSDIGVLGDIRRMIDSVTSKVTGDWPAFRDQIDVLEREVAEALAKLSPGVTNEDKKIILGRINRCLTMKDKGGRVNPYSRLAILNSTKRFIARRLGSVSRISGYIAGDDMLALSHMGDDTAQASVASGMKFPDWYDRSANKRGVRSGVDKPLTAEEVPIAIASLKRTRQVFSGFKFQPYLGVAEKIVSEIDGMLEKLERDGSALDLEGDFDYMRKAFIRVFALAKLIEVERRVIDLRNEHFHPGQNLRNISANAVRSGIGSIFEVLNHHRIAPDVQVRDYHPAYVVVFTLLHEINELAKTACKKRLPDDERVEILGKIDRLMKEFNIGEILEDAGGGEE